MTEGAFLHSAEGEGRILEEIRPLAEYRSQSCMLNFLKILIHLQIKGGVFYLGFRPKTTS